jgi:formylglycine-generating enzyme required for sulfatase activity
MCYTGPQFSPTEVEDMRRIPILILITALGAPLTLAAQDGPPAPEGFVYVNGGTFTIGSPRSESYRNADEVQCRVTVGGYYLGACEVTQAEYEAVMGWNPSRLTGANLPVESVSWFEAVEYCNARSRAEGLTPVYTIRGVGVTWDRSVNGYRLPTEVEWEYACRAGTVTTYNSGATAETLAGTANVADLTAREQYPDWTLVKIRDGYVTTAPVGSFAPNAWGLYDMHGNVFEWCWDWYDEYKYRMAEQTNPEGASMGAYRVFRGGSWGSHARRLRAAYRGNSMPVSRSVYCGFRLVRQ